jgi:hypothetical protein
VLKNQTIKLPNFTSSHHKIFNLSHLLQTIFREKKHSKKYMNKFLSKTSITNPLKIQIFSKLLKLYHKTNSIYLQTSKNHSQSRLLQTSSREKKYSKTPKKHKKSRTANAEGMSDARSQRS